MTTKGHTSMLDEALTADDAIWDETVRLFECVTGDIAESIRLAALWLKLGRTLEELTTRVGGRVPVEFRFPCTTPH